MDAKTFESITGMKNYEGFKSLLKNSMFANGGITGVDFYSCSDETIVFNSIIQTDTINAYPWLLLNQIGVLLSANGPVSYKNLWDSKIDVWFRESGTCINLIVGYEFACSNPQHDCTIALFDLF